MWNPTVATVRYKLHRAVEAYASNNPVSRLFAADGSLLYAFEFIHRLDDNPDDRHNPENFLKCYTYHLPEK